MTDELVPVSIPCPCSGTPHPDGDTVSLRATLGLRAGITLQRLIVEVNQQRPDKADLTGQLAELYLLVGIAEWTLVDAKGKAIPVTADTTVINNDRIVVVPGTIRTHLLGDYTRAAPIAAKADSLYKVPVVLPLVQEALQSSQPTPINGSTSAKPNGSQRTRKRPRRSSTTTSQTDATAAISA